MRHLWALAALSVALCATDEVRRGVWATNDARELPLPATGYQVYMLGEQHGVAENAAILGAYLDRLSREGLRDIAIEEDAVYEEDAQAYVSGQSERLRPELCLRTNVLDVVRRANQELPANRQIRVHLVDIDSPAIAVREHLMAVQKRVGSQGNVKIPAVGGIKGQGLQTVERLRGLCRDEDSVRGLRTIEHSIRVLRAGFEVGTGDSKGSPYQEEREAAIASNIADVVRYPDGRGVLAFYGTDHVSKAIAKRENRPWTPTAARLEQAGLKVFSVETFPLAGRFRWRGPERELFAIADSGAMSDGERLDRAWERWGRPALVYVDPKKEQMLLPTQDQRSFAVDGWVIIGSGSAMADGCAR
jgi:hypothetical protein